ncbi:hypothetical protein ABMX48_29575 [Streptomyces cavourensis]|uniref:hypothetical protein n=1 Tax=Streptomyces TaxID=1883 RepID=UPI001A2DBA71|nr:hypothetical protein [Streptomyces sp. HNA39]MBH0246946.1 hypothetical protein [Streptomyces cavourensis]UQA34833.1 hypothetical protein KRR37_14600 [Streptomyces sp. HNA39]
MTLHFIAKDPETNGDHCPTIWFDDEAREFVIQGWKADAALQAKCLDAGPIPENEAVVRLPVRMAEALKEVLDAAARAAAVR